MAQRLKDMTGKRFTRLFVVDRAGLKKGGASWNCVCDCGNKKIVVGGMLRNGKTKSCGCLKKEMLHRKFTGPDRPIPNRQRRKPSVGNLAVA